MGELVTKSVLFIVLFASLTMGKSRSAYDLKAIIKSTVIGRRERQSECNMWELQMFSRPSMPTKFVNIGAITYNLFI